MTVDTKGPASMTQPYFQRPVVFATSCLLALGLLFAAYSNHFQNGFHFDDSHVIEDNLYIRSLNQIPKFFVDATTFSSLPLNATYRLLLSASYAIDYRLAGGLDPWQFHITQFLMLVCLGVSATYLLLRAMNEADRQWWNRYLALFAATWFCLHTANTETVNYFSSRSDLLSTLVVVLAFCTYFAPAPARRGHTVPYGSHRVMVRALHGCALTVAQKSDTAYPRDSPPSPLNRPPRRGTLDASASVYLTHDDQQLNLFMVPLRDRCSFGRVTWLISQALTVTYVVGEHRLYLERNCRLPESGPQETAESRGACQFQGAEQSAGFGPAVEPRRK